MTKSPLGGDATGAHRHDKTQVEAVFEAMPIVPSLPTQEDPQHFCWEKKVENYLAFLHLAFGSTCMRAGQAVGGWALPLEVFG